MRSRGPVADVFIQELLRHGLAHLFGETAPQPCRLTSMGEAYYERFLKTPVTRSVSGLQSETMDTEVLERIAQLIPDWSFRVQADGGSIQIRLWRTNDDAKMVYANAADYITHPDQWARENPTTAAVIEAIMRFKQDL